jgi:hypothetical protein
MKWLMAIAMTLVCLGMVAPLSALAQAGDNKAPQTIAGKWHFVLNTDGGDRELEADFQLDGKNVTGKFGKDDAKGTYEEGKLNLEFTLNSEEAGTGTMKIVGALANDALTGTWEFQTYSGSYKATRVQ